MSDQIELDEEIQQNSENEINHYFEDNTHQQPLSCDSGKDHNGQEDECVDSDLPFSGSDNNSLVEVMWDISQHQGKPTIQNANYHQVKKFIERESYLGQINQLKSIDVG